MSTPPDDADRPAPVDSAPPDPVLPAPPEPTPPEPESAEPEPAEPALPEPVRLRTVALAAAALPQLPPTDLPPPLRKVAAFAPQRRARLGGAAIAAQLAADPAFRAAVAARAVTDAGELGAAVQAGDPPGAADPVEVAALAYLARPAGWRELVTRTAAAVEAQVRDADAEAALRAAQREAAQAAQERAAARAEAEKLRDELARLRAELHALRAEHRRGVAALRAAEAAQKRAADLLATERGRLARAAADHEAELRRLRGRLAEAQAAAGSSRQAARDARAAGDLRLWLLLETLGQTAVGLRRELGVEPADQLPADAVARQHAELPGAGGAAARARDADDPARLDELLALPRAHLIVDGYNVTKRGYGELSLERQRQRLVTGLAGLAAQTRAEVTVAFDGAERIPGLPAAPRGVRVLFSRSGESADDLIRRLVRAEPAGRPVVVVSSDREVADSIRRHGAYPAAADALLRRLGRS